MIIFLKMISNYDGYHSSLYFNSSFYYYYVHVYYIIGIPVKKCIVFDNEIFLNINQMYLIWKTSTKTIMFETCIVCIIFYYIIFQNIKRMVCKTLRKVTTKITPHTYNFMGTKIRIKRGCQFIFELECL